jgi:hypothetical protein
MSIDVSAVLDLMAVGLEILEVITLELQSLTQLRKCS